MYICRKHLFQLKSPHSELKTWYGLAIFSYTSILCEIDPTLYF